MITPAPRAAFRRLYCGERWKVWTIAAQLVVDHETARAAVEHESGSVRRGVCRSGAIDPGPPFIGDTLAQQHPRLRASRGEQVRQRGDPVSVIEVRRLVQRLRQFGCTVCRQGDRDACGKVRLGHGIHSVSRWVTQRSPHFLI